MEWDAELMLRVREGDTASFAPLLERYRAPVAQFIYRMVLNRAQAEELTQEVFLRVYRSRTSYEPAAKFTTWLFRIATHLAYNSLRNGKKERQNTSLDAETGNPLAQQIADDRPNAEQHLLQQARLQQVRDAIGSLPPKQRAAVLMHKYEEMDYGQIAQCLGCSASATKSLLFRAYETLRVRLAHLAQDSGEWLK